MSEQNKSPCSQEKSYFDWKCDCGSEEVQVVPKETDKKLEVENE